MYHHLLFNLIKTCLQSSAVLIFTNGEELIFVSIINNWKNSTGWCGSVNWALACEPKGDQCDSQSRHMPGLWTRSPVGGVWETTTHWWFSPSLSSSLPLSLKLYKILKKKKKKKTHFPGHLVKMGDEPYKLTCSPSRQPTRMIAEDFLKCAAPWTKTTEKRPQWQESPTALRRLTRTRMDSVGQRKQKELQPESASGAGTGKKWADVLQKSPKWLGTRRGTGNATRSWLKTVWGGAGLQVTSPTHQQRTKG